MTETGRDAVIQEAHIAPCGMNCRLCRAYAREKKPCPGCKGGDQFKPKGRIACRIRNCETIQNGAGYCFDCATFPCARLTSLDTRYRSKYGMSMIENLQKIKASGMERFVRSEATKWACPQCGTLLCVHEARCRSCGYGWR